MANTSEAALVAGLECKQAYMDAVLWHVLISTAIGRLGGKREFTSLESRHACKVIRRRGGSETMEVVEGRRRNEHDEWRRWAVLAAAVRIQALTGTNFDFSAYSSALKSLQRVSQEALNYLATASDLGEARGKAFGWFSGLALLYMPPTPCCSCPLPSGSPPTPPSTAASSSSTAPTPSPTHSSTTQYKVRFPFSGKLLVYA